MSGAGDDEKLSAASYARFAQARQMIAQHARGLVLDIGCGHMPFRGDVSAKGAVYRGLDREARTEGVDYLGDVQDLREIATASVDTVMCFEVLEHVPDPSRAMSEISRVLRLHGTLLLTVPHLSRLHEEPHDYYRYTHHGLATLCARAGLAVESITAYGGLASFVGHQVSTAAVGLTWGIPGIGAAVRVGNRLAIKPLLWLDRTVDARHLFALGYALVARKPPASAP
jgi:SAM-dependent methyltransferase